VCKMKERSKKGVCSSRNANGNTLDTAVIEQVKQLAESDNTFLKQLEKSRQFYTTNHEVFENNLVELRQEFADNEKKIEGLVDSLIVVGESSAKTRIAKRIEALEAENESIRSRITELEELTSEQTFEGFEFDLLRQLLAVFKANIDDMTIEQKRAAIRTVVRKVVWDGTNAHIILFGDADDDIELPDITSRLAEPIDATDEDTLDPIEDADDEADDCLGKRVPPNASKSHWGEGSILHAPGGVSSQPGTFGRIKGRHALDEPNGADGYQILLIRSLSIILLHNVGHKAEVPFNENISCFQVTLPGTGQVVPLLFLRQRLWKRTGIQLQRIQQCAQHQPCGCQHSHHLCALYSPLSVQFPLKKRRCSCISVLFSVSSILLPGYF